MPTINSVTVYSIILNAEFQGFIIIGFLPMINATKHTAKVIRSNARGADNCSKVKGLTDDDLLDLAASAFAAFSNSSTK